MMELLAPAGTMKNFMAALEAGADAVFLGGKLFNARASAGNFDLEELKEAVRIAHLLGVAVHVTVNILVGDKELEAVKEYVRQLDCIGVDAIIVQDLAVARIAQEVAPNLPLHGSTQMTVTNLDTVKYLGRLGFTRVVLARELSLEEIDYICKNTDVEIEVFIHGALCICYSGQCFMSSFIGGRSGNRGACAQPCRKPYELLNSKNESLLPSNQAYIMSPKDLNSGEFIDSLLKAGVASFKIEGRMKQVSYVKAVVGAYRAIIDNQGKAKKEDLKRLEEGFNRGFSQAYLKNCPGKEMMTIATPNNQGKLIGEVHCSDKGLFISSSERLEEGDLLKIITSKDEVHYISVSSSWEYLMSQYRAPIFGAYKGKAYKAASGKEEKNEVTLSSFSRKISVYAYLEGKEGEPVSLTLLTDKGKSVTVYEDYLLQRARTAPTSLEKVTEQLNRMGNTVFSLKEVYVPEGAYMWPASVLNGLRRKAVESLEQVLIEEYDKGARKNRKKCETRRFTPRKAWEEAIVSVRADEWEQVKAAVEGGAGKIIFGGDRFNRIPYSLDIYRKVVAYCKEHGVWISLSTPRIVREKEVNVYKETFTAMVKASPDSISIHFLGALQWMEELDFDGQIEVDTSLNCFNQESLMFWKDKGAFSVAVSHEMTLGQIRMIGKTSSIPLEATVQGENELMVSEYCVIGSFLGTGEKGNCPRPCVKNHYFLRDMKGEIFPLRTDPYCRMHIMNSKELDMSPYVKELMDAGVKILRIEGRGRSRDYILTMVDRYNRIIKGENVVTEKKQQGITRGHYFKGIF